VRDLPRPLPWRVALPGRHVCSLVAAADAWLRGQVALDPETQLEPADVREALEATEDRLARAADRLVGREPQRW
jgi:hypothetical protein